MTRLRRNKKTPPESTREKGDILENIVAEMHQIPGVLVETKKRLYVTNNNKRKREIDVLITSQTAGIPVRIGIECKNEEEKTGVGKIDEFIGKLKDVNLPTQLGIFVSKRGYTKDALDRANKEGIKTLIFEDLSKNLATTILNSFQSVIYLLPSITNIHIRNDYATGEAVSAGELFFFHNKKGELCGSVLDLVWKKWISGKIPETIGDNTIKFKLPTGWKQFIHGKEAKVKEIIVTLKTTGYGMAVPGTLTSYNLVNANDMTVHKTKVKVSFSPPKEKVLLVKLNSEDDLHNFEKETDPIIIRNRIKTPRIVFLSMYWPPSKSSLEKLVKIIWFSRKTKKPFDLQSIPLAEIEGDSLEKLWEPIIEDHPMLLQLSQQKAHK
ncbi:MAG TPA: restriction endonuclease [Anaerolineales bacterium]|nr:restriction endonuclease [Anaerolineales bacterium]